MAVARPGAAAYTGLALGNNGTGNFLYAADFKNKRIDVFNSTFAPVTPAGNFVDPNIPDRYAPFNIQNLGGKLYVTYARQDRDGGLSDGGNGFVSVFDLNGNFIRRLVSNNHLKAPWGLSLAPAGFGEFGGALLVGNHGDGRIHAYNPNTGRFLGRLRGRAGPADPHRGAVRAGVRERGVGRGCERPVLRGRPGRRDGRAVRLTPVRARRARPAGGDPGGGIRLTDGAVGDRAGATAVKADGRFVAEPPARVAGAADRPGRRRKPGTAWAVRQRRGSTRWRRRASAASSCKSSEARPSGRACSSPP